MSERKTDFTLPCETFRPEPEYLKTWNEQINDLLARDDLDSVMSSLACIVDEYEKQNIDHIQRQVYWKALDWLQSLKIRLEKANQKMGAIQVIEYMTAMKDDNGNPIPSTKQIRAMAYNRQTISDEDAITLLESGRADGDPRITLLGLERAHALFPELRASIDETSNEPDMSNQAKLIQMPQTNPKHKRNEEDDHHE